MARGDKSLFYIALKARGDKTYWVINGYLLRSI